MQALVGAVVQIAMVIAALKLYFYARRKAKESRKSWRNSKWRRRCGLLLFLLPLLLWVASWLLPEALQPAVEALRVLNRALDRLIAGGQNLARQELGGIWGLVAKPILVALVYTLAGVLIGWPLDRWLGDDEEVLAEGGGWTPAGGAPDEEAPVGEPPAA